MGSENSGYLLSKLRELQLRQAARRAGIHPVMETDEIGAIKKLAFDLFGDRGVVEFGPQEPGIIWIGCFDRVYPPGTPSQNKKRALIFRGATHAELAEQASAFMPLALEL